MPETMHLVLVRPGEFEGTSKKRTTTGQYIMHNVLLSSLVVLNQDIFIPNGNIF